jgi:hypothetical protein
MGSIDLLEENKVKELSHWDMGRTVQTRDGYDSKTIPEACPKNMQLLMDKINELCKEVNSLKRLNAGLIDALKYF